MKLRFLKNLIKTIIGKGVILKKDISCETECHGSAYGKWTILKDSLSEKSIVYSFGVGEDVSFDLSVIQKYNCCIHGFDPTPRVRKWIESGNLPAQFKFYDFGIANLDGEVIFSPPANPNNVSFSMIPRTNDNRPDARFPVKRLSTIMRELNHSKIDLLKMDVEGAEYSVLDDMLKLGNLPRQLLIEFHHRFPQIKATETLNIVSRLRSVGYKLFSISERYEEFGFVLEDQAAR